MSYNAGVYQGGYNQACLPQAQGPGWGQATGAVCGLGRSKFESPTTGASHASHLGCPSAYNSRVSYVKKRQVWKSWSETDWPHLGIITGFSTEKIRSILMLTSTCWQDISLSNTVELTTVTTQKQKICRFKCLFFAGFQKFQRFHWLPSCSKSCDAPWLGGFVFTYICWLSHWNGNVRKNKTAQSWHITGFAAHRQTMEPLEFSKTGKKQCLKRQIFCFCGVTVVSSTTGALHASSHLGCLSAYRPSSRVSYVKKVLFFMYATLLLYLFIGRWSAQVTSMRGTCGPTCPPPPVGL